MIPICYFPLQKVLVDTQEAEHSLIAKTKLNDLLVFNDPQETLNYLQAHRPLFNRGTILEIEDHTEYYDLAAQHPLNINIQKIKHALQYPKYKEDIGVIIVNLDALQGFIVPEKAYELPMKKILIYSAKDEQRATDALNKKLVNFILAKEDPSLKEKLLTALEVLTWEYFNDISNIVHEIPNNHFHYLNDPELLSLLKTIMAEQHIVSFGLIDHAGTFVLINNTGDKFYLVVRNSSQLNRLAILAKEEGGTKEVINALEKHEKLPFYGEDLEYWQIAAKDWAKHLFPAKLLSKQSDLYWTLVHLI